MGPAAAIRGRTWGGTHAELRWRREGRRVFFGAETGTTGTVILGTNGSSGRGDEGSEHGARFPLWGRSGFSGGAAHDAAGSGGFLLFRWTSEPRSSDLLVVDWHLDIDIRVNGRGRGGVGGGASVEHGALLVLGVDHGGAQRGEVSSRDGKLGLEVVLGCVGWRSHGGEGQRGIIFASGGEMGLLLLV